jgi:hypothetical protein
MRNTVAAAVVAVLVGSGTASAAALPGFVLTASTERVRYYSRGERIDVRGVETALARIEGTLGTRLASPAAYYRYASAEEVAAGTGHRAAGVTLPGQVHTTRERHDHELVHLVAAQMGDPGRFFQEGLAVALADEQGGLRKAARKALAGGQPAAVWVAGFDRQDPAAAYAVAGTFVRHLIETQGMDKVRALFRASRSEAGAERAFAAVFGQSVDAAFTAWRAEL